MFILFIFIFVSCAINPKEAGPDDSIILPENLVTIIHKHYTESFEIIKQLRGLYTDTVGYSYLYEEGMAKAVDEMQSLEDQLIKLLEKILNTRRTTKNEFIQLCLLLSKIYNLHEVHHGYGKYILLLRNNLESISKTTQIDARMKTRLKLYLVLDFNWFLNRRSMLKELSSFIGLLKSGHYLKAQNLVMALVETLKQYPSVETSQTQLREEFLIPKVQQPEKPEDPSEKPSLLKRSSSIGDLIGKELKRERLRRSLSQPTTSSQTPTTAGGVKPSKDSGQEKGAPTKAELEKKKEVEIPKDLMKKIKEIMECLEQMIKNLKSLKSFSFQNQILFTTQFWATAGMMEMNIDDIRNLLVLVEKRGHINIEMMEEWMKNMANHFNLQNLKAGFGNYIFYISRNIEYVNKKYSGNEVMLRKIMKMLLLNDECIEHLLELVDLLATLLQMNNDDAFVNKRYKLVDLLMRIKTENTHLTLKSLSTGKSGAKSTEAKRSPTTEKK
ncbi:hypothetical protein EIN_310750 [Entamoeba invadens IP1]|uniref:Uncharacterized protein n=1 Tax=Entamoeba invadens IP1 TaxID=370355 RepID=L7FM28_ENTIV|nr:hypothetical protein EIN_310750 [Entamoeba invadens IP1]ELP84983.1 hypothetical protein EIN_310750 [Entamoeba invadens IP1]|eukprot:XP_004184329.1 hypothetical protein EIN_310750 [Entamoeba invadens IP1]